VIKERKQTKLLLFPNELSLLLDRTSSDTTDMKKIRQKATDMKRKIKQKANRHQMKTIDKKCEY